MYNIPPHQPGFTTASAAAVLSRRSLLRNLGLAGLGLASGLTATPSFAANASDAWAGNFRPFDAPGFQGELRTDQISLQGQLPRALRGTLYRNGPARFARGDSRLSHWFDGDGMLQALRFEDGRVSHHGRMLSTPKAAEERAAGRFLYGGFGSTVRDAAPVGSPDVMNVANINVLPMNGGRELYALWEAGSALQVNPDTLVTQGHKTWSAETAKAPFSAHPRVSPDGTVWNFGYLSGTGKLLIYHIGADGVLKRQAVLEVPQADMVHDFAMTENHLVFLLQPLKFQRSNESTPPNFLANLQWNAQSPLVVCVVSKADLSHQLLDLPNGGLFHLGNAWEDAGLIRLGYARQTDMMALMNQLHVNSNAQTSGPGSSSSWTEVEINLARRSAVQRDTGIGQIEFPRWNQRSTGQPTTLAVLMQRSATMNAQVFGYDTVVARSGDRLQQHAYGDGWIAEEHLVVPHPTNLNEQAGWIIGSAYHWPTEKTTVSVFEASGVAQGPVAQLRLPYGLPLGLHGQFVAV